MNITSLNQHPFAAELTDEQVEKLSEYSKLAVLRLDACSKARVDESATPGYEEPLDLDEIK